MAGIEGVHARDEIAGLGFAPEAEFVVAFKTGYRMGMPQTGPLVIGAHGAFSTSTVRPDMHASFFIAGQGSPWARISARSTCAGSRPLSPRR